MAYKFPEVAPRGIAQFTATGTWTAPDDVTKIWVTGSAGGGAGGGSGSGGGAGGGGGAGECCIRKEITVTPGTQYTITIGAGGTGVSDGNGGNGTDTTISSSLLTLVKGNGGQGNGAGGGGGAGGGPGGNPGRPSCGVPAAGANVIYAGDGGSNVFGEGARGPIILDNSGSSPSGVAAKIWGTGGSGAATAASTSARAGGNGAGGILIIEW